MPFFLHVNSTLDLFTNGSKRKCRQIRGMITDPLQVFIHHQKIVLAMASAMWSFALFFIAAPVLLRRNQSQVSNDLLTFFGCDVVPGFEVFLNEKAFVSLLTSSGGQRQREQHFSPPSVIRLYMSRNFRDTYLVTLRIRIDSRGI